MNNSFRWSTGTKSKESERNHRCFNLAFLYFKNNDLDAAEKCARDSIAVDDTYRGRKLLGDILLAKKRSDEALLEYQKSIELNSSQEDAYLKVCELLSASDNCDVDSLKYWCERAERNGLIDVVERFQEAIEKGAAFPGRVHMNTIMKNVSMNNSLTNGSADVLDTSHGSRSGADLSRLSLNDSSNTVSPGRVIPSPAERAILSKVNSQEVLLKNILSQQQKLLDTHRILREEILANRGSIDTLRTEMNGLKSSVAEVKAFAGALGTMSAKLNDISEGQKELKDYVYELNLNNYNEDEYEDMGEDQENVRQVFEPISPALNVNKLPNFGHMNISGFAQQQPQPQASVQNNMNKTPNLGVFSRLGEKSSTPLQSPAQPVASSAPIQTHRPVEVQPKSQPSVPVSSVPASSFSFSPPKLGTSNVTVPKPASSKAIEPEVEVVYEKTPPQDLVDKAKALELPKNYYNYLDAPDCKGCRGCEKEGTVTVTSTNASLSSTTATTASSVTPKTTSVLTNSSGFATGNKPLFGTSTAKQDQPPVTSTSSLFSKPAAATDKPFSFGFALNTSQPSNVPLFGAKATDSTSSVGTPSTAETPKSSLFNLPSIGSSKGDAPKFSFGFGSASSTSDFGSASGGLFSAAVKETVGADCADTGFKWGGTTDGSKPKWMVDTPSQIFGQKICSPNEEEEDEENPEEDSVDDNLFILPTVQLPDQIEIKTGEEDEDIIYCQRAKLYRYDQPTKQWKERGIGDLKILKHQNVQNRYRIVLRREQVHKIACNHYLTSDMKFAPMANSENSVCWFARDYAEEEYADEQFCVKFKNKEILKVFTDKIEELQKSMAEGTTTD